MITPFPVPIHSLLQETNNAVMRTNEKPNLPVPSNITIQIVILFYFLFYVYTHER